MGVLEYWQTEKRFYKDKDTRDAWLCEEEGRLPLIRYHSLEAQDWLAAACSTRKGGVSTGFAGELNLGFGAGDIPENLPIASGIKGEYQKYALSLMPEYGWADSEMYSLIKLWDRESGWNPNAHNGSSGAHGIAQALPASKMASEGSDYYTNGNTQIRWGLGYIARRYGSPSNAWAYFCSNGWY